METGGIEKSFGKVVRKLREDKGYSQESFASFVGIDRSYHGRIERGEVSVTLRMIQSLSKAFGLKTSALLVLVEKLNV